VQAVVVFAAKVFVVPEVESAGEHDVKLEVDVRAFAVDASAGVAHFSEFGALGDSLAGFDGGGGEVGVEAVDRAAVPVVFDDNVFAVVAIAGVGVDVGDGAGGHGIDGVEWVAGSVAFDRFDIDTFVELGADDAVLGASEGADKAVFSTCPRPGSDALEHAGHIHVECIAVVTVEMVVDGGECEFGFSGRDGGRREEAESSEGECKNTGHG